MSIAQIIFGIVAILIGTADEYKYWFQYKKIKRTKKTGGVSRRMILISVFSKLFVLSYALVNRNLVFGLLYSVGAITSGMTLVILYRYSRIRKKTPLKFFKSAFHITKNTKTHAVRSMIDFLNALKHFFIAKSSLADIWRRKY